MSLLFSAGLWKSKSFISETKFFLCSVNFCVIFIEMAIVGNDLLFSSWFLQQRSRQSANIVIGQHHRFKDTTFY